jgi:hypothetical protein
MHDTDNDGTITLEEYRHVRLQHNTVQRGRGGLPPATPILYTSVVIPHHHVNNVASG